MNLFTTIADNNDDDDDDDDDDSDNSDNSGTVMMMMMIAYLCAGPWCCKWFKTSNMCTDGQVSRRVPGIVRRTLLRHQGSSFANLTQQPLTLTAFVIVIGCSIDFVFQEDIDEAAYCTVFAWQEPVVQVCNV